MPSDFNTFTFHGSFLGWSVRKIPTRYRGREGHERVYEFILQTSDEMEVVVSAIRSGNSAIELVPQGEWVSTGGRIIHRDGRMCFHAEKIASPTYTAAHMEER